MDYLLQDTNFWVLVSFIIFAFAAVKFGRKAILGVLDTHIDEVRTEIETAENLRVEAQELLAQYQRKYNDAVKESERIIKDAEVQAKEIKQHAESEIEELTKMREKQLQDRLKRIEEQAMADIRKEATDLAVSTAIEIIAKKMSEKDNARLVDATIATLPEKMH